MSKFRVVFEGEPQDELYDTYEEAEEAGLYMCGCADLGAETLHLSNPGDYDYDENDEYEFKVEKIN